MSNVNGRTKDTFDITAVVDRADTDEQVTELLQRATASVLEKALPLILNRHEDRWVTITIESAGHIR